MADPVRTMVVWCLDWPVVAAGVDPGSPVAVLYVNRVVASSAAARRLGVHRGLRRREAQRRCPELVVVERDEAREARLFEPVVAAVETFTPRVEITRPGRCRFATRGPSRYFGGDDSLAAAVRERVTEVLAGRTECRIGVADGPFAAEQAARSGSASTTGVWIVEPGASGGFLAPLPITSLARPELTDVFMRLGLRRLGDLAALPAPSVLGRFGTEGATVHRLASGLDEERPDARDPPADLEAATEIDPPAERVDQVAFVGRALADQLHQSLDARGLACTRVAIEAETEHGEHLVRLWRHEGTLGARAIADRVRWQLDGWLHASARPTGGITRLALVPDEVVAARGRQLGFWGGETAADERALRAIARVEALLGPDAVRVAEWQGGRAPGEQLALVPAQTVDLVERTVRHEPGPDDPPWPGRLPAPAPARVHPDPLPARVVGRSGAVVSVTARGLASEVPSELQVGDAPVRPVVAWAGPWVSDERWWDAARHRRRARFQLITADGAAHLVVVESRSWAVEATYD